MQIENQLDPKWARYYIGKVKASSFHDYACFLFCLTYLYSLKQGRQVSPAEVDKLFIDNGVYMNAGDEINSVRAAKVLGLQYFGVEADINKAPNWHPSIKRVDYSARPGKQFHFVVREADANGHRFILDPVGGVQRDINYYEKLVGDTSWTGNHGFEYRLWKV